MKAYRIKGWSTHYENNRSRELKRPEWLPLPNSFEGRGYMELCDNPAGMSHYGAWCMLLAAASRMPTRGLLVADSGAPLSIKDIARMTRGSAKVFEEALPRLLAIGWVEETEHVNDGLIMCSDASGVSADGRDGVHDPSSGATIPQASRTPMRDSAGKRSLEGEGEGELEREREKRKIQNALSLTSGLKIGKPEEPEEPEESKKSVWQRQLLSILEMFGCSQESNGKPIFLEWCQVCRGYSPDWIRYLYGVKKIQASYPSELRKVLKAQAAYYEQWVQVTEAKKSTSDHQGAA